MKERVNLEAHDFYSVTEVSGSLWGTSDLFAIKIQEKEEMSVPAPYESSE